MIFNSWSSLSLYFKNLSSASKLFSSILKTLRNFSFNPSNESFLSISSALPPFSELIFGSTGLENCGLKLHLNGKLKLFSKASGRSENSFDISSFDLK